MPVSTFTQPAVRLGTSGVPSGNIVLSSALFTGDRALGRLGCMRLTSTLLAALLCALLASCSSVYYSAWEQLGKEKRDLLRDNVEAVRSDQKEVAEDFRSALDRLRDAYGTGGGALEQAYDAAKRDYTRSEAKAATLRKRILKVETIAADLFNEWEREAATMHNENFKAQSIQRLSETQRRFEVMRESMRRAERSIDPVLADLSDHMLYLKHSLNTQAVEYMGTSEVQEIEQGVSDLLREMDESIRRADDFLGALGE